MERDIILLGGKPGSGKSRLGRELTLKFGQWIETEHISLGERVRAIGRGTLDSVYRDEVIAHLSSEQSDDPMIDDLASKLINESLEHAKQTKLIFLDGYPRYETQVGPIYNLAEEHNSKIRGLIVTEVDDKIALSRMLMRDKKNPGHRQEAALDPKTANDRLIRHKAAFFHTYEALVSLGLPTEVIDTSKSKETTTERGLIAAQYLLSLTETLSDS